MIVTPEQPSDPRSVEGAGIWVWLYTGVVLAGDFHRCGGGLGNLIVTDGDPLEIQTQVRYVLIKGIPVDTENGHRRLW